jgi:hypothetical protein
MRTALAIIVAVGCGDDRGAADAPPPDAPEEPVAIRVTRQSVPLPEIAVVFQRADASIAAMTTTDADGRAEALVGQGGFVTAVTSFAANQDVKTFIGVSPGDQLVIDGAQNASTPMTTYTVRVTPVGGAVSYRVGVRCLVGTGETFPGNVNPVDLPVTTTCLAPTETLVTALDNFGFPVQSVLGAEATPTAGGVVDLTSAIPVTAETATITLANVPPSSLLEPSRVIGSALFLAETEPATNGAHPIVFPDVAGARQTIAITGARPVFAWGAASGTQTVDVAALQVASINTPTIDRATSTVSWQGGTTANFAFGQLTVMTGGTSFLWSYAGAIEPGATQLQLPPLAEFPLATATQINLEIGVGRVEVVDELRRDGAWLDANNGVMGRQQTLFRPPSTPGSAGLSFVGANLTP